MIYAVVMPVFNEVTLFPRALARLEAAPPVTDPATGRALRRLIVVVDDGSRDGTAELVGALRGRDGFRVVMHEGNKGKGAAVRSGLAAAMQGIGSGPLDQAADLVIIQDADLEYDPTEHQSVLSPILDGRADAVIGSRFLGGTHRVLYYWHSVANRLITFLSNVLTNLNLTDIECCFKAFSGAVARDLKIQEDRFGVEPEIIARLSAMRLPDERPSSELPTSGASIPGFAGGPGSTMVRPLRIYEVPVSYAGRTYAEGKKITWQDGLAALRCIVQYNVFS